MSQAQHETLFCVIMRYYNIHMYVCVCLGVKSVHINLAKEEVLVETALTSLQVQSLIESTGRRAVLKGMGSSESGASRNALSVKAQCEQRETGLMLLICVCCCILDLGAAVAMVSGAGLVQGVVRFLQLSQERCLIDGTIDGLAPGAHGLHVHELGDLTQDCMRYHDL